MADEYGDRAFRNVPDEQVKYANLLFWGSWIAIATMVVTYVLYVSGIMSPHISPEVLPQMWTHPSDHYVSKGEVPLGWGWVALLGRGDFLNFVGMVILAAMSAVCFLATLLPAYIKQKDWIFVGIVVLEVLVLTLAASGILGGGGH